MSGSIDFTMGVGTQNAAKKISSDKGYRIYIFGEFSAQSQLVAEQFCFKRVDLDNFEQVISSFKPVLNISSEIQLDFESLDDFHPDSLLQRIQLLTDLQQLKRDLNHPQSAEQAVAKIQSYFKLETTAEEPTATERQAESSEDMMQRLLGQKPKESTGSKDSVSQFIEQIISPHIQKQTEPHHQDYIDTIDLTISQYLQQLLHHQDFQRLEALWRSTEKLINEELSDQQCFYLVDISKTGLMSEMASEESQFEQKLIEHVRSGDGEQDILFVADYYFSEDEKDRYLLKYCADLTARCNGLFLAGADQSLVGNLIFAAAVDQQWSDYLREIDTDRVMLSYPGFLLRLPYGQKRDAIDTFGFEECSDIPQENELLWGNSAFLSAGAMVRTSQGQASKADLFFDDIPVFAIEIEGEQVLQPGTQIRLTESQANTLLMKGIMPYIGYHQRPGVRLIALSTLV